MPPTQVAYGIMVCYSIFMVFSANLLMVAIIVSAMTDRQHRTVSRNALDIAKIARAQGI